MKLRSSSISQKREKALTIKGSNYSIITIPVPQTDRAMSVLLDKNKNFFDKDYEICKFEYLRGDVSKVLAFFDQYFEKNNKFFKLDFLNREFYKLKLNSAISSLGTPNTGRKAFVKNESRPRGEFKKDPNFDKVVNIINNIPIFKLLEIMNSNGQINILKTEKNGREEIFYKIELRTRAGKSHMLKISTQSPENFELSGLTPKSIMFSEVYFEENGRGAVNLVKIFEQLGFFGAPLNLTDEDEKKRQNSLTFNFVRSEVIPKLDTSDFDYGASVDVSNSLSTPSRLPLKMPNSCEKIIDYLINERKLDQNIVWPLIKSGDIYGGTLIDYSKGNKVTMRQNFFALRNMSGEHISSERLYFRGNKLNKLNISDAILKGNSFEIHGKSKKKRMTVLSEAAIDAMSVKNLFDEKGFNTDELNFFSIQGAAHFKSWFEKRCGFEIRTREDDIEKYGLASWVNYEDSFEAITKDNASHIIKGFENKKIVFLDMGDSPEAINNAKAVSKAFKEIGVSFLKQSIKKRSEFIDYKDPKNENTYFIDATSIGSFLESNNISINKGKALFLRRKRVESPINFDDPKEKEEVVKRVKKAIGSEALCLSLDNDYDGLKFYKPIMQLSEKSGLKCLFLLPPRIKMGDGLSKDNNDTLKLIKTRPNQRDAILSEYFSTLRENPLPKIEKMLKQAELEKQKKIEMKKKNKSTCSNK